MMEKTYLSFLCKLLENSPCLFTCPRQRFRIFEVLPKRILPELADATGNDVFDSILDGLTAADFVD